MYQHILACGYYLEYEITDTSITSVTLDNARPKYDQLPSLIINETDLSKQRDLLVAIRVKAAVLDFTQQYLPFPLENAISQPVSLKDCSFKPIADA